ncbi:8-oxo-dGTP pyrophosphatase MutT (NUDIX family) [Duganella sp. 3397]|uniref:Putative nudix hydrolase NudL n=1 Tax=Duganella phyllosphaerae TaxID=762836 RepID=A0A1E7WDV2_9BURK|nr:MULTISPECIES: CoA pyrophosphatase [Duganella]MDR7050792.1 8-oxo-dGTP pyrophosphatase MutT (NUDIX family) [Duganella sp. 3397]OEZ96247.1 putative nudix hydrolase NudL [Duganella phyllosphaerae]
MAKLLFDPRSLPIDAIAGEPGLALERLNAGWLRQRFAEQPEWSPEAAETSYAVRADGSPATAASVLIALVQRPEGLSLVLTQRNADLTDHPGQISFPGGRAEAYDASPVETALREAEEEISLDRTHVEVIGTLPDYYTGTGYRVTPVVALVTPPVTMQADPGEVEEIFEVPLAFLMDGLNHQRLSIELPSGRRSFYAMPYGTYYIWGATAGMLRNLFHFLRA